MAPQLTPRDLPPSCPGVPDQYHLHQMTALVRGLPEGRFSSTEGARKVHSWEWRADSPNGLVRRPHASERREQVSDARSAAAPHGATRSYSGRGSIHFIGYQPPPTTTGRNSPPTLASAVESSDSSFRSLRRRARESHDSLASADSHDAHAAMEPLFAPRPAERRAAHVEALREALLAHAAPFCGTCSAEQLGAVCKRARYRSIEAGAPVCHVCRPPDPDRQPYPSVRPIAR